MAASSYLPRTLIYPRVFNLAGEPPIAMHGGPDAQGAAPHDFSTNGNACGPCEEVVAALRAVDATHYPDPLYTAMRERLAAFHDVTAERIVVAASASEFIFRITAAAARQGVKKVKLPLQSYGDYRRAAEAWGLTSTGENDAESSGASLVWLCDPSSPMGQQHDGLGNAIDRLQRNAICVFDLAYEPMRLDGRLDLSRTQRDRVWQLWTPNKALGLTGIRAAYAIAPAIGHHELAQMTVKLAPSWPVGSHGVALLENWASSETQGWLYESLATLRDLKARQIALCIDLGWTPLPSVANFFCVRLPDDQDIGAFAKHLREQGIKLRDTTSFGLPGHIRLAVANRASQRALETAMRTAPR